MTNNYAVVDCKSKKPLSRIMISLEDAKSFLELCLNKNARLYQFGWYEVNG